MAVSQPADQQYSELLTLTKEPARLKYYEDCEAWLASLPGKLATSDAPTHEKARKLYASFRRVLDESFEALQRNQNDEHAQSILAAGCLLGLVTEAPGETGQKPSAMDVPSRKGSGVRQALAGKWTAKTARSVRKDIEEHLKDFRYAVLEYFDRYGDKSTAEPASPVVIQELSQELVNEESVEESTPELPPLKTGTPDALKPKTDEQTPGRNDKKRPSFAATTGIVVGGTLVSGLGIWGAVTLLDGGPNRAVGTTPSSELGINAITQYPRLIFDDLGGGSTNIRVYAGVTESTEDKKPNGVYNDGDAVTPVCKTEGRSVSSHPELGEQERTSKMWIRIHGASGVKQYATAVYIENHDELLRILPEC